MRAAVLTAYNEPMVIEEITAAPMGPRDVLVHIDASGVCHSDLSMANGSLPLPPPVILGHEGAGTVLAVGGDVTQVRVGDRVIASFVPACGNCFFCLRDQSQLCEQMGATSMVSKGHRHDGDSVIGMSGLGTFADEMTVDESMLVKVETDLPSEELALIGCGITTGVGAALNTAAVKPGSTVTVIGCGGVGQSVLQGARIAGASRIFAVDPVEMKRKTAEQFGATDLIDPADGDPVEQIRALTGGRGTDYAFEVIGLPETIVQAFQTARRGGTVVVVGMPRFDAQVTFPGMSLFADSKQMLGCMYGSAQVRRDFPRFVQLVETGRLDIGSMVSRRIKLDEVNDAFRAMEAGEVIRSVIT
ncbi:MAG: S-(hydroxymethyl)glutathione dehydrogenase / alcohol dehydrogenase [Actinomycetota bacterium]|jgi:S-(hydroxymethyl)glutathione dehydrogenase/alcohol dehydrogenase|nr:S-(hydroxymethyl)glutathione dehydrogenase / alcohol dehydrogenase [Actinomycetota bacterium]